MKCLICGMNISLKSINVNDSAFLEKNTEKEINYCPFCGAAKDYITDSEISDLLSNNRLTREEFKIIDHAMKLEIFNGDFYKEASRLADSVKLKEMFQALSRIEYTHARIHQRLCGIEEVPELSAIDYTKYKSDDELLKQARTREVHAVDYYNKYFDNIDNDNVKTILKELRRVEEQHIELIEK